MLRASVGVTYLNRVCVFCVSVPAVSDSNVDTASPFVMSIKKSAGLLKDSIW